jgi:hypothetical protein
MRGEYKNNVSGTLLAGKLAKVMRAAEAAAGRQAVF